MGWKIYFWIYILLTVVGTVLIAAAFLGILFPQEAGSLFDEPWTWLDWLNMVLPVISIFGLFGLAYQKTIGKQSFWKWWFVFILIFDTSYTVHEYLTGVYDTEGMQFVTISYSLLVVFLIPYYVALLLYGYKSEELWNPQPSPLQ